MPSRTGLSEWSAYKSKRTPVLVAKVLEVVKENILECKGTLLTIVGEKEKEEICGFCGVPLEEIKVNSGSKLLLVCNNINCEKFRQPQGVRKIYFGREAKEGNLLDGR